MADDLLRGYLDRARARPSAKPAAEIDYDAILRQRSERAAVVTLSQSPAPEHAAEANRISRQRGLPANEVASDLGAYQQHDRLDRFLDLSRSNPKLGEWITGNPHLAAAAADDSAALRKVAGALDARDLSNGWSLRPSPEVEPTLWNSVKGVFRSLVEGGRQVETGLGLAVRDWLPRPSFISEGEWRASTAMKMREFRQEQASIDAATPAFRSSTARGIYSGVSSLAQMMPAIAATIATRSPYPAVMMAGAQTAAPAYGKYRARGASRGMASVGALGEGTIEAGLELLPFGTIASKFGRASAGKFIGEYFGKELATEQLTTLAQDAIDTAIANPDKSWADYWAERPAAAYETAVATLAATGTLGALNTAAQRSARRQTERAFAEGEGYVLDRLAEGAAESKLRGRDPETFRAMLDKLTEGMVADKVYLPADALREFMQSEGFEETDFWRERADDIAEAEAIGGDLVIPLSEAITHLSDRSTWNALRKDMRLSPGGFSRGEIEAMGAESGVVDAELEGLIGARGRDPRSSLFAVAFQKLSDAGYSGAAARTQAEFITERYATRAERRGEALTGREFDQVGIEHALPEKLKAAAKADTLDLIINALRKDGQSVMQSGPTLAKFVAARGGVNDSGGDLRSMGLDRWHREKPFRRKLLRDYDPAAAMGAITGDGDYGPDSTLRAAIEAGYFPELNNLENEPGEVQIDGRTLIDALGEEMAGKPRYASAPVADEMRVAADDLREMLSEFGRDPDAMTDQDIRDFLDRFDKGEVEGQAYRSGERGRILFTQDGKAVIQLFKSRNLSTFLHESGHLFLEELREDAARPNASDQLKADWQTVVDWFSANKVPLEGGSIPVAAHELFARGFERRLMEGNAPSTALAKVFETFRSWLVAIYRRAQNLQAPITDDIREVMDRLVATDDAIAEKRQEQALDPVFSSMAEAGMTRAEFDEYMNLVAQSKTAADSEMLARALSRLKAAETARYRELEAEVRAEVARAVDARPDFAALDAVRSFPLNRAWIVDRYGEDALDLMPKGVPPSHKVDGAHPDTLAERVGLKDGRDLVETLMGMEKRRKEMRAAGDTRSLRAATIDAETDDAMAARHGDPFVKGEVEEAALAAVHNDMQGEVLAAEVRALARRTGQPPTPYSMAREWARRKIRGGEVRDHVSGAALQQYRRAAAANARFAFDALSRGDYTVAFRHKQAQLVNNALVREAREVKEEIDQAVRRLDRTAKRKTIAGVAQAYLSQAHALLEEVDLRQRSGRQVDRQESFEAWASAREDEGHTIAVPRSFATTIGKTNWTRLSADNLLGLDDAVRQILHLGRLKQTLVDKQEERELDKAVDEARQAMDRLPLRKVKGFDDPTKWDDIKAGVLGVGAALLKMETVFKRLDGSGHGPFGRFVFQPIREAQGRETEMLQEIRQELAAHLEKVPAKVRATWNDQVELTLYDPRTHEPIKGPRSKLIAMALNVGNEGNLTKLAGGYGWRPDEVMRTLDAELDPEEWLYVQRVWDTIEKLWPRIVEVEKRVNGIAPDKVRAKRVNTSAGILRGGYYPVVYDPERSRTASEHAERSSDKLFENNYTRASTSRGFTKERTQVERPILLSLDVMDRHVAEVVHDVTHREAVMQADRFLSDRRILNAVDETMGPHISGLFRPWLQFVANEWAYDRAGVSKLETIMRGTRRNVTFVGMAYRISTIITQAAGYGSAVERIGPKWLAQGLNVVLRNPKSANAFALERSHELRSRFSDLDRDIRENTRRLIGQDTLAAKVQRYGYAGIGALDRLVVVPLWVGAYNKAIAAGLEESQAIHEADSAVNESQGGGAAKDLAAISRGRGPAGELGKSLTMFYSWQSANFNRIVDLYWSAGDAWRAKKPEMVPELAARAMMLTLVVPVLGAILTGGGPDEDNEEGWTEWAAKLSLYGLAAPIPVVREVVPAVTRKAVGDRSYGYRFTPMAGLGESLERVAGDVNKIASGEETTQVTRNTIEALGYLNGLTPTPFSGQMASSGQFFVDVVSGASEPQDAQDWWQGVTKGRIEDQ